jgi:basic membrane protein A and related proteins
MNGFAAGVLHHNTVHGTHVRLLGWNPKKQSGLFVSSDASDFDAFADTGKATTLTGALIRKGADVIFPVDGTAGETGSCAAAQQAGGVLLIGVDTDQYFSTPRCEARWATSVLKIYRRMVFLAMKQIVEHRFKGGLLQGTLANGGDGLADFHSLSSRVPASLRHELDRVRQEVGNRSITVDPQSYLPG